MSEYDYDHDEFSNEFEDPDPDTRVRELLDDMYNKRPGAVEAWADSGCSAIPAQVREAIDVNEPEVFNALLATLPAGEKNQALAETLAPALAAPDPKMLGFWLQNDEQHGVLQRSDVLETALRSYGTVTHHRFYDLGDTEQAQAERLPAQLQRLESAGAKLDRLEPKPGDGPAVALVNARQKPARVPSLGGLAAKLDARAEPAGRCTAVPGSHFPRRRL